MTKQTALSYSLIAILLTLLVSERTISHPSSVHAADAIMTVSTQADITLNGSTAVAIGSGTARTADIIALSTNSAAIRCADSTVSASRGIPIAPGGSYRFDRVTQNLSFDLNLVYDLSALYCYGANGDKFALVRRSH